MYHTKHTHTHTQKKKLGMWFNGILQVDGSHTLVESSHRLANIYWTIIRWGIPHILGHYGDQSNNQTEGGRTNFKIHAKKELDR